MLEKFSHNPTTVTFDAGASILNRIRLFLGHYDLRIFITPGAYIDVGRGSFNAALRVCQTADTFAGCVGTVGQFCDFAEPCKLMGGGEHHNTVPVNVLFTGTPFLKQKIYSDEYEGLRLRGVKPFQIGNGVVISSDAKIMSGANLADGVIVGANAVATGCTEPFEIYGGVPAKKISSRFDADTAASISMVRWWDFDLTYLGNNIERLQKLSVDRSSAHEYRKPMPRLILNLQNLGTPQVQVQIPGFIDGSTAHSLSEAPTKVIDYVKQIGSPGPQYQWIADVWNLTT